VAVINPNSGRGDGQGIVDAMQEALPDAEVVELGEDDDVADVMSKAAARAEVLAVGGGDGTINAAAAAAIAADVPLLVLPAGTFNHFARDIDLCELDDAVDALHTGRAVRIDVGDADGKIFLNTASLGSYPEFVKVRERWEERLGKPVAAAVAILTVLRKYPPLSATVDGVPRRLVLLFVGNGEYKPRGYVPRWRARLDSGRLDLRFVDASRGSYAWGLLAGTLTADLYRSSRYVETRPSSVDVHLTGDTRLLARDGEIDEAPDHVTFSVRPKALTVYRGRPQTGAS
jgi:undecaprenyl-diphosphatase